MCDILVIAQFHENLAWIESAASETREMRIVRYTKESGNYGRESASYIRFIAEHYRDTRTANDTLVCFSQGSIRGGRQTRMTSFSLPPRKSAPYTPLFNSIRVRFDSCGRPDDRLPCLMHIATSINITTPREANVGAFFRTTMRALRAVPLDVWWHLYHLHFTHTFCRLPWVMERLWENLLSQRPALKHTNYFGGSTLRQNIQNSAVCPAAGSANGRGARGAQTGGDEAVS